MKKSILILTGLLYFASGSLIAQEEAKKAKIYIKKSENGNVTEYEEEIPIVEGQDLQELLNDMDIWKEFEDLKVGETIELNVNRFENGNWQNALNFAFSGQGEAKPFLGVMIQKAEGEGAKGVEITEIIEGTAAEKSELRSGDVITKINKEEVNSVHQLIDMIKEHEAGESITVHYERDGKEKKTKIELGEKSEPAMDWVFDEYNFEGDNYEFDFPYMGEDEWNFKGPDHRAEIEELKELQRLEELGELENHDRLRELEELQQLGELENLKFMFDSDLAKMKCDNEKAFLGVTPGKNVEAGVQIAKVIEESSAAKMGLQDGDVVLSIDGVEVNSFDELADNISNHKAGDIVELKIKRNAEEMNFTGELGSRNFGVQNDVFFFRDYKGMNENGDQIYEFELDMDQDDVQRLKDEIQLMQEEIERNQEKLRSSNSKRSFEATIEINNITEEEAARINETAEEKLSLKDDLEMATFSFFPNPSSGEFNLKFDLPEKGNLQVMIYDQSGAIVYNERITGFQGLYNNIIDLSMFSDGVYYMQVIQNQRTFSKKLVKGS